MTIKFEYNIFTFDADEMKEVYSKKCKCGHTVVQHASPLFRASSIDEYYFWLPVAQCIFCTPWGSEHVCQKFELDE